MSGARLPIVSDAASVEGARILVGESRETVALGIETPHGYPENERVLVQRKGDCLVLLGNDDEVFTGTAFAVTMLLEKLGCGWFGPEELWQEIPTRRPSQWGTYISTTSPRSSPGRPLYSVGIRACAPLVHGRQQ